MQARNVVRTLKGVYFAVLIAATGIGVWAAYPYIQDYRTARASPLSVQVYPEPFISLFSDTSLGASKSSTFDTFISQELMSQAMTEILQRKPAPFAKDADRDAWSRDFAAELTASLNNTMGRRYRDSLERLEISAQVKGQVLVQIENVSQAPVDEVRLEVAGGQLFMEAPPTPKLRSLGTRAMRFPTIAPGEKTELLVLTTQEVHAGGPGPVVQVTSKGQSFPVVVHTAQEAQAGPSVTMVRWIAAGTLYVALILAGLGLKVRSVGVRLATPAPSPAPSPASSPKKRAAPEAPVAAAPATVSPAAPATAPPPPVEPGAWRRPSRS